MEGGGDVSTSVAYGGGVGDGVFCLLLLFLVVTVMRVAMFFLPLRRVLLLLLILLRSRLLESTRAVASNRCHARQKHHRVKVP